MPDFTSLRLEHQVEQVVIARRRERPLMERYVKEGIISNMTHSLTNLSLAEVAEFTNRFEKLSRIPLLFGLGGISYSRGRELRIRHAMRLSTSRSRQLCRGAARIEAMEDRALGYDMAAATNLDVNVNPDNPIINLRSLGDDVALVTELGTGLTRGTLDGGAAPELKQFPGHGATSEDSHIVMPEVARCTVA